MHNFLELSKQPNEEGTFLSPMPISWMKKPRLKEAEQFKQTVVLECKVSSTLNTMLKPKCLHTVEIS